MLKILNFLSLDINNFELASLKLKILIKFIKKSQASLVLSDLKLHCQLKNWNTKNYFDSCIVIMNLLFRPKNLKHIFCYPNPNSIPLPSSPNWPFNIIMKIIRKNNLIPNFWRIIRFHIVERHCCVQYFQHKPRFFF